MNFIRDPYHQLAFLLILLASVSIRLVYFRAYFVAKQRNLGNNPDRMMRKQFPFLVYYLFFWTPF
jgi:hypothetical protein